VVENIMRFCWNFHPLFSSERILKIGLDLIKLLPNIWWLLFLEHIVLIFRDKRETGHNYLAIRKWRPLDILRRVPRASVYRPSCCARLPGGINSHTEGVERNVTYIATRFIVRSLLQWATSQRLRETAENGQRSTYAGKTSVFVTYHAALCM